MRTASLDTVRRVRLGHLIDDAVLFLYADNKLAQSLGLPLQVFDPGGNGRSFARHNLARRITKIEDAHRRDCRSGLGRRCAPYPGGGSFGEVPPGRGGPARRLQPAWR